MKDKFKVHIVAPCYSMSPYKYSHLLHHSLFLYCPSLVPGSLILLLISSFSISHQAFFFSSITPLPPITRHFTITFPGGVFHILATSYNFFYFSLLFPCLLLTLFCHYFLAMFIHSIVEATFQCQSKLLLCVTLLMLKMRDRC